MTMPVPLASRLAASAWRPLADGAATLSSAGTTLLATVVCEQPQQPLWKQRIHQPFLEVPSAIPMGQSLPAFTVNMRGST